MQRASDMGSIELGIFVIIEVGKEQLA